ncbi:hypothetical protein Droror1_Dr00001152 [Drosera rotundifolia]
MCSRHQEADTFSYSKGHVNRGGANYYANKIIMDMRMSKYDTPSRATLLVNPRLSDRKTKNFQDSFSQVNDKRTSKAAVSFISLKSSMLLMCLTASLVILPLVLPPLPPPPSMLLLLPICILAPLVVLAFMPSKV